MTDETNTSEVSALLRHFYATQPAKVVSGSNRPFLFGPADFRLADLEHLLPRPTRKRAAVTVSDAESLIKYALRHGGKESTMFYADVDFERSMFSIKAVLNDHQTASPDWCDHTCTFHPALSIEWKRWVGRNGKQMGQGEFATWLEDNLPDIISHDKSPSGSEILTMALGFEANADKRLRSKVNLQSGGVQFEFVDDEDKDTRSRMQVFERFTLGIPVFDGSAHAYPMQARLKYRTSNDKLTFWYELIRPDRVFRSACNDVLQKVADETEMPILKGRPQ